MPKTFLLSPKITQLSTPTPPGKFMVEYSTRSTTARQPLPSWRRSSYHNTIEMRSLLPSFLVLLVALLSLTTLTHAAKQPTSYCKCICFQNSTIIPLNSPPSESSSSPSPRSNPLPNTPRADDEDTEQDNKKAHHHTLTCNDCNRAFCLDYNLPICKNAKEEDVFAQCFRMSLTLTSSSATMLLSDNRHLLTAPARTRLPERPHDRDTIHYSYGRLACLGGLEALRHEEWCWRCGAAVYAGCGT